MNKKKKILFDWWINSGGSPYNPDDDVVGINTTADGKQGFLIIGDSIAAGSSGVLGPVTATNTLFNWNGTSLDEITTTDISTNPGGTDGTMWKQFAIDHKANTGYAAAVYNAPQSSSEFYPNGDSNNWYTSGSLYDPMKTSANAMLASMGITRFKGIHIILGINDVRGAQTQADVNLGIDSLMSRLLADFPETPILICQLGQTEGSSYNVRLYATRTKLRQVVDSNELIHFCGNLQILTNLSGFIGDNLHPNQTSNNLFGSMWARHYANKAYSKMPRAIISSHPTELNTTRKDAIEVMVQGMIDDGDWASIENLFIWDVQAANDQYLDFGFVTLFLNVGTPTITVDDSLELNGTDSLTLSMRNDITTGYLSSATDFFHCIYLKTNNIASGVTGYLFGTRGSVTTTSFIQLLQSASGLSYRVGENTNRVWNTETKFADNSMYGVARNGTLKELIKNGVVVDSTTLASNGNTERLMRVGAFDGGSVSDYLSGTYRAEIFGKRSTIDLSRVHARINTYIASI